MKKIFIILSFFIALKSILSYPETTHQYITIEAYNLLKSYFQVDIPQMGDHLHNSFPGDEGGPWQLPYLTRGAFREDSEDPIYKYNNGNPPPLYGDRAGEVLLGSLTLGTIIEQLITDDVEMFTSITHFWEPDAGDASMSNIHGKTWTSDFWIRVPNAYQKMLKYINGGWELSIDLVVWGIPTMSDLSGSCATQRALLTFRYNSIIDLFKNKNIYLIKTTWVTGQTTTYNSPIRFHSGWWNETMTSLNGYNHAGFIDNISWEILGRMCHLLQDMSVPAHARLDEHSPFSRGDSYETFMQSDRYWNSQLVRSSVGEFIDPFVSSNPMHFLMYTTAQMAGHFGSDGPYEGDGNNLLLGDPLPEEITYLNNIGWPNLGGQINMKSPLSSSEIIAVRDKMIPQVIRATAGLLYWFAVNTGLITLANVTVNRNYEQLFTESESSIVWRVSSPNCINKNGREYYFYEWNDGTIENPKYHSGITSFTANYKGIHQSVNSTAVDNNSQRKFVYNESDGSYYFVYESLGRIWLEKSTDAGLTWQLLNNKRPIDWDWESNSEAKNPSIFIYNNEIYIVFQQKNGTTYNILLDKLNTNGVSVLPYSQETIYESSNPYSHEVTPVITISNRGTNKVLTVVWNEYAAAQGGLRINVGLDLGTTFDWKVSNYFVTGTTNNSKNPTMDSFTNFIPTYLDNYLAWEDNNKIYFSRLRYESTNFSFTHTQKEDASLGCPFSINKKPKMVLLSIGTPRLIWISEEPVDGIKFTMMRSRNNVTIFDGSNQWYSTIWQFGNQVTNVNINHTPNPDYVIGWTENNGAYNKYVRNTSFSNIRNFNITGKDIQISNGTSFSNMFGITQQVSSPPYIFNNSASIATLGKETQSANVSSTRNLIVYNENMLAHFGLGDIKINGEGVDFVELTDSTDVDSIGIETFLYSEPFNIDNNSRLDFTVNYGYSSTNLDTKSFFNQSSRELLFNIELIDNKDGKIISSFARTLFNSESVKKSVISNTIKTTGVGNKNVQMKITASQNFNSEYLISQHYADQVSLPKESVEQYLNYESDIVYNLDQNYPNPFNPVTIINYQIPKQGAVSLKVYDMLGKEVLTLVNEFKTEGRYSVEFNGSNLSSGLYFYELRSSEFLTTKKMLLIK